MGKRGAFYYMVLRFDIELVEIAQNGDSCLGILRVQIVNEVNCFVYRQSLTFKNSSLSISRVVKQFGSQKRWTKPWKNRGWGNICQKAGFSHRIHFFSQFTPCIVRFSPSSNSRKISKQFSRAARYCSIKRISLLSLMARTPTPPWCSISLSRFPVRQIDELFLKG